SAARRNGGPKKTPKMPENAGEHGKNIREMPEIGSNQIKSAAVLTAADFSYKSGQRHPIRQQPIVSGPTDCSNGRNDKKAADRASSVCQKAGDGCETC
ncbi:hypothetical protein, partial [Alistipes shahii]|uniref:hypothetical protein n=1 Tax=Alistipes shahii TaxID=328814 RepID=UPI003AB0D8BD